MSNIHGAQVEQEMIGMFGVMLLSLSLTDLGLLSLHVNLNKGEALGLGTRQLKEERVYPDDLKSMLESIEMFNNLACGRGKQWRFNLMGGQECDENGKWVTANFSFRINLVGTKSLAGYSRLGIDTFVPDFKGAMFAPTIEGMIDRKSIDTEYEIEVDPLIEHDPDLVTYIRERTPMTAPWYCPEMGLEKLPKPIKTVQRVWFIDP